MMKEQPTSAEATMENTTIEKPWRAREPCARPGLQASESLQGSIGAVAIGFREIRGRKCSPLRAIWSVLTAGAGGNRVGANVISAVRQLNKMPRTRCERTVPTLTSAGSIRADNRGSSMGCASTGYRKPGSEHTVAPATTCG